MPLIPMLAREQAADVPGTKLAVVAIVRACFQARAWSALNENILLISKRRSQLKQAREGEGLKSPSRLPHPPPPQAITAMVQESMTFLDATPDVDTKVALIKTLVTVAEGKVRSLSASLRFSSHRSVRRSSWRSSARG